MGWTFSWKIGLTYLPQSHARVLLHAQPSTKVLNPPQNMRLPSKGNALGSIMFHKRGSFNTLVFTRSRCARDLNTIHEKITVSPGFSLTLCGNDVYLPGFTSSATHSRNSMAPCSRQIFPAF